MRAQASVSAWLGPAAGVATVILAAGAFLLARGPGTYATDGEYFAYFSDNATALQWQTFLFGIAAVPFFAFITLLIGRIVDTADPVDGALGRMILAGAAATMVMWLIGVGSWYTLTQFCCAVGGLVLIDLADSAYTLSNFSAAVLVTGLALALLRSRVLPVQLGGLGLALLALLVVNGLLQVRWSGDWDTLGDVTFFLFLLWTLLVALVWWWSERAAGVEAAAETA